jgi:DNA-binding MarR family transcriptional regulator
VFFWLMIYFRIADYYRPEPDLGFPQCSFSGVLLAFLREGRLREGNGLQCFGRLRRYARTSRSEEAAFRLHLTGQLLICIAVSVAQVKAKLDGGAKQMHLAHSRQQDALLGILRTANYLRRFTSPLFDQHGITSQQFNVLRILRGAGLGGLPTLDIAERMIEQTPGITRLLDRLERKKLVRRERPSDNRRQVLCYITKPGLDLLQELDTPVRNQDNQALHRLDESEIEELIRLLALARGEQASTT